MGTRLCALLAGSFAACGGGVEPVGPADGGAEAAADSGAIPDAEPPTYCEALGLSERPFAEGPYGLHRRDLAEDFTVPLLGGAEWSLRGSWTGCDSHILLPDTLTPLWGRDVDRLIEASPKNVHYFFVSRMATDELAQDSLQAQQEHIDAVLGALPAQDAEHWRAHLHVVAGRAANLDNWIAAMLEGIGRYGFAIDRLQRLRQVGYVVDVYTGLPALSYVAHEARYHNQQAGVQDRLDAQDATVVELFSGETLAEFADATVELPAAAQLAGFDTFEVEVTMGCPDPDRSEFDGNCGAWDYIAWLGVDDGADGFVELARFITAYDREAHWVVDATPMMVHLLSGGTRTFRWSFAPSWNPQPTATWLALRFSNQGKGYAPSAATFLFPGRDFNSSYNVGRPPVDVPIPADAARVELFAVITGHGGGGATNCAEFCNNQHEFTIDGATYLKDHAVAGTTEGCIGEVDNGMTPNQGGTWWYGRAGWCPGEQVTPWVVDVTGDVTPGSTAAVSYRGLYDGQDPPPDTGGNIAMASYLVVYR